MEMIQNSQGPKVKGNFGYLSSNGQRNSFPTFHSIGTMESLEIRPGNKEPPKCTPQSYYPYNAQRPYQTQYPYQSQYPSEGQFPFPTQYPFYPFQNPCRFQNSCLPTTEHHSPHDNQTSPLQPMSTPSGDEIEEELIDVVSNKSPSQSNDASTSGSPCQLNNNNVSPITISPETRSISSLDNTSGYQSSNGSNCGSPYTVNSIHSSVCSKFESTREFQPAVDNDSLYSISTSITSAGRSDCDKTLLPPRPHLISIPPSSTSPESTTESAVPTKKKKSRTNYKADQLKILETNFNENAYPDCDKMEELSLQLDVAEQKIEVWFQNRRARWRKRNAASPVYNPHMSVNSSSVYVSNAGLNAPKPMYPAFPTSTPANHVSGAKDYTTIHHRPFPMMPQSSSMMTSVPVSPFFRQPAPSLMYPYM